MLRHFGKSTYTGYIWDTGTARDMPGYIPANVFFFFFFFLNILVQRNMACVQLGVARVRH